MTLGQYLKRKRRAFRQTQAVAAAEIGVTRKTWRLWEQGIAPHIGYLPRIASWAGVTLNRIAPMLEAFDPRQTDVDPAS